MKYFVGIILTIGFLLGGCSKQTPEEKMKVEIDTIERSAEEAENRLEEAECGTLTGDSKLKCLAKKVKNSAEETKDEIIDKSSELKDKVDDD
jgi:hypothetical protein